MVHPFESVNFSTWIPCIWQNYVPFRIATIALNTVIHACHPPAIFLIRSNASISLIIKLTS